MTTSPSSCETVELALGGMSCAACAARIEKQLNKMPGVEAAVNFAAERAHVRFDPALASRVLFLLDLYGFNMTRVKLLDGGTVGWTGFNELTKARSTPKAPGKVTLKAPAAGRMTGWTEVYRRVVAGRDPQITLIDARPADMYDGTRIQHSVQGGHIPGAINIVSLQGVDGQSQQWKSLEEIAALYKAVGKDRTVITYCHDGFRSTLAWLQLKALGYTDVRVYNGGWSDWDRTLTLPVVKGSKPLDADFEL